MNSFISPRLNSLAKTLFWHLSSLLLVMFIYASAARGASDDFVKGSIAYLPPVSLERGQGLLPLGVEAIFRQAKKRIEYDVFPFARSMNNAISGKVDFHAPLIEPLETDKLQFKLSTVTIFHVNFVLYYHKDHEMNIDDLEEKEIETDSAHIHYFKIKIIPSTCVECSLKKVNGGRLDGFIFADTIADNYVRVNKLKNIRRKLYHRFNVKFVLPKNKNSEKVDRLISLGFKKIKENGEWEKYFAPMDKEFEN